MAETTACVLSLLIVCLTLLVLIIFWRLTDIGQDSRLSAIREAIEKHRETNPIGSKLLIALLYSLYVIKIGFWGMMVVVFGGAFSVVGAICGADLVIVRDILRDFYCFIQSLKTQNTCNFSRSM